MRADAARQETLRETLVCGARLHHIGLMSHETKSSPTPSAAKAAERRTDPPPAPAKSPPAEIGGPSGPEPTRFGDWERNGRCTDF
jgi:hypothetical protein